MEITLPLINEACRKSFGQDSFVATFVRSVNPSSDIPTACISKEGHLLYNPEFTSQYLKSNTDLFCLIAHELMHPLFGHFIYSPGFLENLAADIVINAILSQVYSRQSGEGSLFRKFYSPEGIEGLLRPQSRMTHSRYYKLYRSYYLDTCSPPPSTGETLSTLKALADTDTLKVLVLIGGHGLPREAADGHAFGQETMAGIAEDFRGIAQPLEGSGSSAGHGNLLYKFTLEMLKPHTNLKKQLLGRYAIRNKTGRFLKPQAASHRCMSPIPIHPGKRELVLLGAGCPPLHYTNRVHRPQPQHQGLAVYLDVSGSVLEHLPRIIGLLRPLQRELKTVHLFSNKVVEVPLSQVLQGNIQSTYGTDFDCIAQSLLENKYGKCVVFTDGFACMDSELESQLKERRIEVLTVLFGGQRRQQGLTELGEVVQLEDIVE